MPVMRALLVSIFLLGLLAPASCLVSESSRSFMKRDDDMEAEEGIRCSSWDEVKRHIEMTQRDCRGKGTFGSGSMDRCVQDHWKEDVNACIPMLKACGRNELCPALKSDRKVSSGPCGQILDTLCTEIGSC
eukprot:TRINITY_DN1791_c0_g1_i1.p1 TRINITY_DN1791_c0_g1~~TRINITY_DN1791_c0_g1_i1.p1  ORF type:complete len:131 (+),score=16.23 TRINITY_DN1791_c0_g1_i1:134-526(+)